MVGKTTKHTVQNYNVYYAKLQCALRLTRDELCTNHTTQNCNCF